MVDDPASGSTADSPLPRAYVRPRTLLKRAYHAVRARIARVTRAQQLAIATTATILALLGLASGSLVGTSGCAATSALGTCEVGVLEKALPGSSETIADAAISAVASGGATLPALLVAVGDALGPGTVACLTTYVDALISTYLASGSSGSASGSGSATVAAAAIPSGLSFKLSIAITDLSKVRAGLAVLHSEMRKRGLSVNTTVVP